MPNGCLKVLTVTWEYILDITMRDHVQKFFFVCNHGHTIACAKMFFCMQPLAHYSFSLQSEFPNSQDPASKSVE